MDHYADGARFMPGPYERNAPVLIMDSVDSTNDRLSQMAKGGAKAGTVLIARTQTAGRGRMSRVFESPENGLYLSVLEKPHTDPARISTVTPVAALALVRTIEKLTDIKTGDGEHDVSIKWPNDVQIGRRKVSGILTELHSVAGSQNEPGEYILIIGIGVNVNTALEDLPEDLQDKAGSIALEAGYRLDMDAFAKTLITEFDCLYLDWEQDRRDLIDEYRRCCNTVGKDIYVIDTVAGIEAAAGTARRRAYASGINDDFSLSVVYENGKCGSVNSGEVSVRVRNNEGAG